jgi:hypothetical protein
LPKASATQVIAVHAMPSGGPRDAKRRNSGLRGVQKGVDRLRGDVRGQDEKRDGTTRLRSPEMAPKTSQDGEVIDGVVHEPGDLRAVDDEGGV